MYFGRSLLSISVDRMPTFLVLKNSSVVETIRGANPPALTAAVRKAVNDAASGPAKAAAVFQSKGYTLGSATAPSRPVGSGFAGMGSGAMDTVTRFFALYFVSLFSLDGYHAAEASPFAVRGRR